MEVDVGFFEPKIVEEFIVKMYLSEFEPVEAAQQLMYKCITYFYVKDVATLDN